MHTLVVGASGFLGGAFTDLTSMSCRGTHNRNARPYASIPFDFWTDDPADLIDRYQPEAVVFAATVEYHDHDVPRDVFADTAERFVSACQECRFIYVSSDAVFDGTKGLYPATARPAPVSEYGHRLAVFEDLVRSIHGNYCIVRPSYLFGFARGVLDHRLARTRERLRAGETVERFTDMYRSPVAVTDAARAVEELLTRSVTGVVHCGGPRTSVYEFHRGAMEGLGVSTDRLVPTHIPEERDLPRDCSLDTNRLTRITGVEPTPIMESIERATN